MRRWVLGMRRAAVVGAIGCSGCSFIFVHGPPENAAQVPPAQPLECTHGKVAPIVDTVIGGYQVVRTVYAVNAKDADYSGQPLTRESDIAFGVGFTALFLSSAIYGYVKTGQCSRAEEDRARRAQERPSYGPGPYAPYSPPPAYPSPGYPPPAAPPAPAPASSAPPAPAPTAATSSTAETSAAPSSSVSSMPAATAAPASSASAAPSSSSSAPGAAP